MVHWILGSISAAVYTWLFDVFRNNTQFSVLKSCGYYPVERPRRVQSKPVLTLFSKQLLLYYFGTEISFKKKQ